MDVVTMHQRPPVLRRPVLVAAFEGWNDAGEAASTAVTRLQRELEAREFASIDPEHFFDFQVSRPIIEGTRANRTLRWPRNRFSWAPMPGLDRHVVLLEGTEPSLRWRTFTDAVLDLAVDLGVEMVVTLGSLQVDAPHTRPVPVSGTATSPELSERLALQDSMYEGPTGITGVVTVAATEAALDVVSLWAGVPHYMAASRYYAGALALAGRVGRLLGVELPFERLKEEMRDQQEEVSMVIVDDPELAEYVVEMEQRIDAGPPGPTPMVSGDELVRELERFLRERDE